MVGFIYFRSKPHSAIKPFRTTYLGLGSNMGDRFSQIQAAIDALFSRVGPISKISPVYSSPAMGFEGDEFLNCAVEIQTRMSPSRLIRELLQIEKGMGRHRSNTMEYASRPIDIDVLFYNDKVIERKYLSVPHPRLHQRSFVLQPLCDIAPDRIHPKLKKPLSELLEALDDATPLEKQSKWLRHPKSDLNLGRYSYLAIEGNIGAGKTSLATQLAQEFNARLILERFKDNPFLPRFYEDPQRYAFSLEMSFLADRYQQLAEDITQYDLFAESVVADYDAFKSIIFGRITLADEEFELFRKLFALMHRDLPRPELYVYLYQHTDRLLQNIEQRGREYEQTIEAEYLDKINAGYLEFIRQQHLPNVKVIDISDLDLVENRADYLSVVHQILDD